MEFNIETHNSDRDFFHNGEEFLKAAWRCYGEKNEEGGYSIIKDGAFCQLPIPTVVNSAFACEMFLKSLLKHHDVRFKWDHNLLNLYKLLPEEDRTWIARFCGPAKDGNDVVRLFEECISKHALDFKKVRYYVENVGWNESSPMYMLSLAENMFQITRLLLKNEL